MLVRTQFSAGKIGSRRQNKCRNKCRGNDNERNNCL